MFEAMNQMLNHLNYYFLIIHYYKFIRKTWFQMANFIKTFVRKKYMLLRELMLAKQFQFESIVQVAESVYP